VDIAATAMPASARGSFDGGTKAVDLRAAAHRHPRDRDERQAAVTAIDQVLGGEPRGLVVVRHHVADARGPARCCPAVVADDDHAAQRGGLEVPLVGERRHDDHAPNTVREQVREKGTFLVLVAVGAADQQAQAVTLLRAGLDLARDRAVHRVRHRRHEQTEQRGLPGLELLRELARAELQRLDRGLDARERLGAHAVAAAIQHVRDRARRDTGVAGDILDRGHRSDRLIHRPMGFPETAACSCVSI